MSDASKIALLINGTIEVMGRPSVQAPTSSKTSLFKIDHFSKQAAGCGRAVLMSGSVIRVRSDQRGMSVNFRYSRKADTLESDETDFQSQC